MDREAHFVEEEAEGMDVTVDDVVEEVVEEDVADEDRNDESTTSATGGAASPSKHEQTRRDDKPMFGSASQS